MSISKVVIIFSVLMFISPFSYGKTIRSGGFQYNIETPPRWVKHNTYPLANQDTQHIVDIDYLLADQQILAKDKRLVNFYRYAQRPLNISGLERASKIEIDFEPSYQKLIFHSVVIVRNGKEIKSLKSEDIKLIRQEKELDQGMLNGRVTALMLIPSSRVGDIIDYSFSIVGQNPVFENKHFVRVSTEYGVPLAKSYFRFITAANKKYYTRLESLKDSDLTISKKGQNREYVYEKQMVPALIIEANLPPWFNPFPTIEISEFNTWEQVSKWASKMYFPKDLHNKEVKNLIKELKPLNKEQQIVAALRFVQTEIRYLGLEMASNSHKPHHPDTVVKNRYGDCKDKTVLLISILKKLGIKAYPALVNTRGLQAVAQWQPSPGAFNHVITMVELDGLELWLDPTRTFQEGQIGKMAYQSFSYALLLNHAKQAFVKMPEQKPADNHQQFRSQYIVRNYQQPVDLTITQNFYGNYADWKRAQFSKNSLYNMDNQLLKAIQYYHPNAIKVNKLRILDDKEDNIFSVISQYRLSNFFEVKEGTYYYNLNAFSIREQLDDKIEEKRSQPYSLSGPAWYEHQVAIDFPGADLMSYSQAVDKLTTAQLEYTLTRDNVDLSQEFNHQLIINSDYIPPEQSLAHKQVLEKIRLNSFETWHLLDGSVNHYNKMYKKYDEFLGLLNKLEQNHVIQN